MKSLFLWPIKAYQRILSPLTCGCCRYRPTCSQYMKEAIQLHGAAKGIYLGTRRILSCHPYSSRDYEDPVPKRFAWRDAFGYNLGQHKQEK